MNGKMSRGKAFFYLKNDKTTTNKDKKENLNEYHLQSKRPRFLLFFTFFMIPY